MLKRASISKFQTGIKVEQSKFYRIWCYPFGILCFVSLDLFWAKEYTIKMVTVSIRYYNVWFYLKLRSDQDVLKYTYLARRIKAGESLLMKDIFSWCKAQGIQYKTRFRYRKDFPLKANLWNFWSYLRGKAEKLG